MKHDTNHSSAGSDPKPSTGHALDAMRMFTPMIEFGAGVARMQQRMFTALLGVKSNPQNASDPEVSDPGDVSHRAGSELHDVIAERALQISQSGPAADPVDNWLQAEREVLAKRE